MNWLVGYTGAIMEFTIMIDLISRGEETWGDNLVIGAVALLSAIICFVCECKTKALNDESRIEQLAKEMVEEMEEKRKSTDDGA